MSREAAAREGAAAPAYAALLSRAMAWWEIWPLLAGAFALLMVYLFSTPFRGLPFDDSYISLLFARNLADHGFLTFDGETASAGATSLLHVATLAALIKLGIEPLRASIGAGILLHLALVVAVYWLGWTIFRDRLVAALAGASVAVTGYLVFDALNGLETTLFLVMTTAAAAAFLGATTERRYLLAGVFAALAVLSRPEGVLLLGAMGLYYVLNPERGDPLLSRGALRRLALLGGPSAAALAGLAAFYWATTGSPTPGTATAKYLFFREFEMHVQARFEFEQNGVAGFLGPIVPWVLLAALSFKRRETLLFAFFWVGFILLYFMLFPGGTGHYWSRYQHVFLPALAVFGAAGLVSLLRAMRFRVWDLASAFVVAVVLLGAVGFQINSFREHYRSDVLLNETRQVGMALYLRDTVPPGGTIATHDIGAIGYFSERKVIDLVGLVEPDVIEYHDGRRLREYVDQVQPDYIVVFPSWEARYLQLGLEDDPTFEEVRVFTGGVEPFIVYRTNYGGDDGASAAGVR